MSNCRQKPFGEPNKDFEKRTVGGPLQPPLENGELKLRVFLDGSCLEVFTGTGAALTTRVYRFISLLESHQKVSMHHLLSLSLILGIFLSDNDFESIVTFCFKGGPIFKADLPNGCRGMRPKGAPSDIGFMALGGTASIKDVRSFLPFFSCPSPHSGRLIFDTHNLPNSMHSSEVSECRSLNAIEGRFL